MKPITFVIRRKLRVYWLAVSALISACGGGEEAVLSENYRCASPDGSCSDKPLVSLVVVPAIEIPEGDFEE